MMMRAQRRLPDGRHFALTWGIEERHGGMTSAMLRRSRAFRRLGGVDVDILTLDDRPDYPALENRLRASGALVDGLRVRNLWDDLRTNAPKIKGSVPEPVDLFEPEPTDVVSEDDGVVLARERRDVNGALIGVDRFRRDGSVLATERSGRIVVHDVNGVPRRGWKSRWGLYRWWFDRLTGGATSFLLVDSKTAARSVAGYRRENVTTVHIVHASHRLGGRPGTLRASREYVLRRADEFDGITVLTDRQRRDLVDDLSAVGVTARVRTIANGIDLPERAEVARERAHGVVIGSLDPRKRLTHAVEAAARAHEQDASVTLDVFGTGPQEAKIARRVRDLEASEYIRLRGFDPSARSAFRTADFSLLTSTSEGLPLVLVEGMASGCVPIAYDVRYGPGDMIRDGVDGFLIPEGDIALAAQRIVELQRMPEQRVEEMRRRAIARAAEFSDDAITRLWARELRNTFDAKRISSARDLPLPERLRRRAGVARRRMLWALGR